MSGSMSLSTLVPVSIEAGLDALCKGHIPEAIRILEACCQDNRSDLRDQLRAQMHLIKIYQAQGKLDRAIDLCQQLLHCSHAPVQIWAEQAIKKLRDQG